MSIPSDLRLLESHEWHQLQGSTATLGITQIAADELTDVTYVALPKVGDTLAAGDRFGEIESVKATSDLYTGLSGKVTAINEALTSDPGLINREPYTGGWMIKLAISDPSEADKLLTVSAYEEKSGH